MINADVNGKNLLTNAEFNKRFIWNPNNIECECDKTCDVAEKLNYENFKCRKKLIYKLVEECSEDTNGNERIHNSTLNDYEKVCKFCKIFSLISQIFHNKHKYW